jgi:hypothetical protein
MTIRVTHIYRAASTAIGISSIVTPISHPPISVPEIRAPPDQAALDVCSWGTSGRASSVPILKSASF